MKENKMEFDLRNLDICIIVINYTTFDKKNT